MSWLQRRKIEKALEGVKEQVKAEYLNRRQVYYYGRRPRNYATRQQKTKRLLKQAGISYTRRNIVKDAFERLGVF